MRIRIFKELISILLLCGSCQPNQNSFIGFKSVTGRETARLRCEEEIASVDGEIGGSEEFGVIDRIGVRGGAYPPSRVKKIFAGAVFAEGEGHGGQQS